MKFIALLVLVAAWACFFFAPSGTFSRLLQLLVFGGLGLVMSLAGGFQYYWASHMLPGEQSAFILICGVGTLASQAGTILVAVLGDEGGTEWPVPRRGKPAARGRDGVGKDGHGR